jgi:CBS domain-containing protein
MIDVYVDQIMTGDTVTVDRSQTLGEAGSIMRGADIKSVVVSDPEDRPVGILTSTDFVRAAADGNSPAETDVSDYMTRDVVTTAPDTDVHAAADLMMEHSVSHLPVVGDDGRLVGVVTTTDVAAYVAGADALIEG